MRNKRVLLCQFHQESNTFNPIPASLEDGFPMEGQTFYERIGMGAARGALDVLTQAGVEVVPTFSLNFNSGGRLEDRVLSAMCERMEHYIRTVGDFDGVCAILHGATCSVSSDDVCGDLLALLRKLVGDRPMAATCDLHANVTDKMLANADIICGYQTYPHVDHYRVGCRAAGLLLRKLEGERLYMATVHVPMMVPPAGYSDLDEPFKSVIQSGHTMVEQGLLEDFSVFNVQPWLDISEIASTAVAIAKEAETAKAQARALAQKLYDCREGCWPDLMSVDAIIDHAEGAGANKPVILVDSADSANGGAVGDGPYAVMRLLERGSALRAAIFIKDPAAVERAMELGVGGQGEFRIGAGYTAGMPGPLVCQGQVRLVHDGAYGPGEVNLGRAAVVRAGNVDIIVCDRPRSTGSPQIFRQFGMDPAGYDLVVVKANTSFRAAYRDIAGDICYADTPGAGASNLRQMQWNNLPAGFYPFDLPEDWQAPEATVW